VVNHRDHAASHPQDAVRAARRHRRHNAVCSGHGRLPRSPRRPVETHQATAARAGAALGASPALLISADRQLSPAMPGLPHSWRCEWSSRGGVRALTPVRGTQTLFSTINEQTKGQDGGASASARSPPGAHWLSRPPLGRADHAVVPADHRALGGIDRRPVRHHP
jgi:hypothetical protein